MAYSNTQLANITIDLKWDMDLLQARYAVARLMPLILNKSDKVSKSGQQVSIQIKGKLSVGVVAAGGGFTPTNPTPTQANIVVNLWKYVAIEIDDMAKAQSFWDPTNDFPKDAGYALAVQYDTDIAAQFANLTTLTAVGDAATGDAFDDTQARAAFLRAANANIPRDSLSFALPPVAIYNGWMAKTELTAANSMGLPKNVNQTGLMTSILGAPAYESTVLAKTNANQVIQGALFHKEAFGIAMQLNHRYRLIDRTPSLVFTMAGATESLYGVQTLRADHGVLLNIRNT